ncbi:DNA/RNA nuclease SfsA [Endothiovibrio diazotrophicus]
MDFPAPLIPGRLIRRYKRFLADVELDDGRVVTAHTPNTGSMAGCAEPGSRVWLSDSGNPKRKYPLSWELVEARAGVIVGINTALPNRLVKEAVEQGVVESLGGFASLRSEVPYGAERSRIDLLLEDEVRGRCFIEVKNVTLVEEGVAYFPDAVSERGAKHLRELMGVVEQGARGVIFFCVQRGDAREVRPADRIDPRYGETLRQAIGAGVEALAYRAEVSPRSVELVTPLPVVCP